MNALFQLLLALVFCVILSGEGHTFAKSGAKYKTNSKRLLDKKTDHAKAKINDQNKALPILFEENKGQFGESVKFLSRIKDFNLTLGLNGAAYDITDPNCESNRKDSGKGYSKSCKTFSLKMEFLGVNSNAVIQGVGESVTKTGYSIGNDPSKWLDNEVCLAR